jgi:serine/threonine-protein kinase/endoribonuclease IRE1
MFAQDRKVDNDGDNDDKEGQRVTINSAGNVIAGQLEVSREVLGYGSMGTMVFRGMLGRGNEGLSSDKGASSSSSSGMKRGRPVAVKRLLQEYHHHAAREIRLLIESDGHPNVVRDMPSTSFLT